VKAILLLAGRSRRFWPLQEKTFFPIAGKTLVEHQVQALADGGVTDITFVGGRHNLELVGKMFPKAHAIEQEKLDLGMQGALLSALPFLTKEPIMVVSANDVVEPRAYKELQKIAATHGTDGAILAKTVKDYFPGGYLTLEDDGRISQIAEKPGRGKEPSTLVNIVAHIHNDPIALLEALKAVRSDRDDGYEQAVAALLQKKTYRAVEYDGFWQAVKYPWHLLILLPRFLGEITKPSIHPTARVHPTASIEGPVILEEHVTVLPHATIVGPVTVGKHSIIGTGTLVRNSSVGEHGVIGFGSEVKGSVLADHVWTHTTYLGDSVVGSNVAFGGGCTIGNFRFDEGVITSKSDGEDIPTGLTKFGVIIGNDSRLGILVGTNPGIKIGAGSFVNGGAVLTEDIPDGSFVAIKDGKVEIRKNRSSTPPPSARDQYRHQ
jgi:NDP-sugar pyrophosphorylase family protein